MKWVDARALKGDHNTRLHWRSTRATRECLRWRGEGTAGVLSAVTKGRLAASSAPSRGLRKTT